MVRLGCSLTVYDQPEFQGEPQAILDNIVENWNKPVGSYECSCSSDDKNVAPTASPIRPSNYPPLIDIPASLDQISLMMKGNFSNHPGLHAALKSNKGKRSTKNAYIVLLGTTGSGKSTTINVLFDNPNVTVVGDGASTTKAIHEFRIPVPVDELGIRNSELRVIDTPGLGDTDGFDKDAQFLANLETFLDGHEDLKIRIPNVVLIFHKFTDNRFVGENSQFVKMLRALNSFTGRLTDKKYSNVIFVFSHFMGQTSKDTKNPKKRLSSFRKVIQDYSRFPPPIVLAVAENKGVEHELKTINGNYKLPNREFYPQNLFHGITKATHGSEDAIGEAVIRSAFRNPDSFNITSTSFYLPKNGSDRFQHYMGIISDVNWQVNKTELSEKLAKAHETMSPELKQLFPGALPYLQKTLRLDDRNVAELPKTTTGIVKLFSELRQNDAVLYLLKKAFDLAPSVYKEDVLTGYSYDVFKDLPIKVSPFEMGKLQNSDIGYQFPSIITCKVDFQTKDILYFPMNRAEYLNERMKNLNIGGTISLDKFIGATKPGHNLLNEITSPEGNLIAPITAVREFRTFELVLKHRFTFTNDFKTRIKSLTSLNATDSQSVLQWKSFFDEYGTHVVESVSGGGAIQIDLNTNKTFSIEIASILVSYIQFAEDISLGKIGNSSLNQEVAQHTLKFVGGENPRVTDLRKLPLQAAAEFLEEWKESLRLSPTILTNEMRLRPISEITSSLGRNISSEIRKATKLLFDSTLTHSSSSRAPTVVPLDRQSTEVVVHSNQVFMSLLGNMRYESIKSEERFERMMNASREQHAIIVGNMKEYINYTIQLIREERHSQTQMRDDMNAHNLKIEKLNSEQRHNASVHRQFLEKEQLAGEIAHRERMANLQRDLNTANARNMNELAKKIPDAKPVGSGCLGEGTLILLADFTQKPVELLEIGETILDHNLNPVRISGILRKFLSSDSFYGFDNKTFFFTDTHLMVGRSSDKNLQIFTKKLNKTLVENPLLSYLNVQELPSTTEMLRYNPKTKSVFHEEVAVFTDPTRHPPVTPVYMLFVEGESGTYFANGFVCRHDIPPLHFWPHTLSVLFSLVASPEIKWIEDVPYNLETINKIQHILMGSYVTLLQILKEAEEGGIIGDGVAPEGLSLTDQVISEIFGNPSFSEFAVGVYATLGPTLADKLEVDVSIRSEEEIRRLQFIVHEGLKEYFAKALSHAFQLATN